MSVRETLAYQVFGKRPKGNDQTVHDIVTLLLEVERSGQNQQDTRNTVGVMQLDPLFELFPQSSRGNA
jgi:hypothetical protein